MIRLATLLALVAIPAIATEAPKNGFCIANGSDHIHLFQTETREGVRQAALLSPGEQLCAADTTASDGVVRVFESPDAIEGCGRIVPRGTTEALIAYAEFDRCAWATQGS